MPAYVAGTRRNAGVDSREHARVVSILTPFQRSCVVYALHAIR